ncbi:MAG: metallophosphoesterase [Deltaproteobacteria bacterium]|nr:metallophosphoesterase [Deltaproteobacteria bacterium]
MRTLGLVLTLISFAALAPAAEHASWEAYIKANRYVCPGPFDTLKTPREITLAGKKYKHSGYRLEVENPDADSKVVIGVMSAIKDTSDGTKQNVKNAFAWFKAEGVEWVVANGDLALEELDLEEVVDLLAAEGLPLLVILGNSESKGSFARVFAEREAKYPNLVNGVWVRQVVADDVELWTLPGYSDRRFVHQGAGCLYKPEDVDLMVKTMTPAGKAPLLLVSHGPPQGKGKTALDWMAEKINVGDDKINSLIDKKKIPFGLFGHILEAGGNAVGKDLSAPVKANTPVASLYLNAGSLAGDPWGMNDGSTATGMAFIVTLDGGKAKYEIKRFKPTAEDSD